MRRNPVFSLILQPRPNIGEVGRLILKITTRPRETMAVELLADKGWERSDFEVESLAPWILLNTPTGPKKVMPDGFMIIPTGSKEAITER
jgi:hypothetical protein